MYVTLLQLSEGMVDKAKGIFYKALQHIPWVKVSSHTHSAQTFPPFVLLLLLLLIEMLQIKNICALNTGFLPGWSAAVSRANAGVCRFNDGERAPTAAAFRRTGYTAGVVTWTRPTFCKCKSNVFLSFFSFHSNSMLIYNNYI